MAEKATHSESPPRRPLSLAARFSLFTFVLTACSIGIVFFQFSAQDNGQREVSAQRLAALGDSLGGIIERHIDGGAWSEIEPYLLFSASDPAIDSIYLVAPDGRLIRTALHPQGGQPYISSDEAPLQPPQAGQPLVQSGDNTFSAWKPIVVGASDKFWLLIRTHVNTHGEQQWLYLLGAGAGLALCAILLFALLIRKPLSVLKQAIAFAGNIATQPNSELDVQAGAKEIDELVSTLNRLSKNWHHRLQLAERGRFDLALQKSGLDAHSLVCITDAQGRIQYVNEHFSNATLYSRQELINAPIQVLNSGYHDEAFFKNLWRTAVVGRTWQGEICNRKKNGDYLWVKTTIVPVKDRAGRPFQYLVIQTDVSRYLAANVAQPSSGLG
jgi:PAS domain S-box-containing protein